MYELHIPWQLMLSFLGVLSGVIFAVLYCVHLYRKDGVKTCDKLAGCSCGSHPKIVPLMPKEGPNLPNRNQGPAKEK